MSKCCEDNSSCCTPKAKAKKSKKLVIDFLYLDLNVCERCQGTENNLDDAIKEVSGVLKAAGYQASLNKVHISSKELAEKYEFLSSPTIRINGHDITLEVKESCCKECGDLCGDSVDCRVWEYEGVEYTEPPKEMIINSILKEVYAPSRRRQIKKDQYILPQNLKVFFDGIKE